MERTHSSSRNQNLDQLSCFLLHYNRCVRHCCCTYARFAFANLVHFSCVCCNRNRTCYARECSLRVPQYVYACTLFLVYFLEHVGPEPCKNRSRRSYVRPYAFYKKLKNVSCEYDQLNGYNSTLQAAWYIRHVRWTC